VSQAISDPLERESELIRITSNDGSRVLIDALRSLDGADLTPTTVAVREPSLADVFLTLTGRHAEAIDAQTSTSNRGGV
jgi:ABC-2 type transport system ATP-binding protein